MSYQISCDGLILHDVRLPNEYRVINPICKLELNTAGTLTFSITPNHPYYDRIQKLKSIITLTQGDEWIFSGRVLNDEKNFYNIKKVEVEGELSYLVDSNQRKAEYHNMSVADYFRTIINKHNAMVDADKQFTLGSVTVTDPNDSIYRISNYENTWYTIQDKLISRLGGYVRTRHYGNTKYIDYVADYENINNQQINFGKNLLNLTQYVQGEDIATAIIPLGARTSEDPDDDTRLTIESVNGGLDYVHDADAVNRFGWIFDTVVFDDVTLPGNLLIRGQQELAKRRLLSIRLSLNAIDLHLMDVNVERIKLGDKLKVISEPHGINEYMTVSAIDINIEDPGKTVIVLGYITKSLTDYTNSEDITYKVKEVVSDLGIQTSITNLRTDLNTTAGEVTALDGKIDRVRNEVKSVSTEIARTEESILLGVSENYASKDEVSAINHELSTQITQKSDAINFQFQSVWNETETINGIINSNQQLLEEYIRFQGALIELGKVGNSFVAKLSNEKLAFLQDNIEIAYISNNKLYITDGEIRNKLTIGNPNNGYFDFIPRENGNLSLKWRN